MSIVGIGQSDGTESQQAGGEGGGPAQAGGGGATGTRPEKFSAKRESSFAETLGLGRPAVTKLRRERLQEGEHWYKEGKPAAVWLTEAGQKRLLELIEAPQNAVPEAVPSPSIEDPAPAGHRYPDDEIPRGPQNGLILEHGRPGWWTADEARVVANKFANRMAILVDFEGRQVICRVKDSANFQPGMIIPVRRYENIVLAARQPRFPGKW